MTQHFQHTFMKNRIYEKNISFGRVTFIFFKLITLALFLIPFDNATAKDAVTFFTVVDNKHQAVIVSGDGDDSDISAGWKYQGEGWGPEGAPVLQRVGGGENLQKYIEQSTGHRLNIIKEKDYSETVAPNALFVGDTAKARGLFGKQLKEMDTDGYIIHISKNFAVLAGNVEYAEFDFLRFYMGIDNYIPTELFTIVPKHETVKIPVETRIEEPAFLSRAFSGLGTDNGVNGRAEIPWRIQSGHGRYKFHHNIHKIISSEEFGKEHPEYFALINGKRYTSNAANPPNPCTSNPEVVQIAIQKCREIFDKHPRALSVSLGMTDAYSFCQCSQCKALDAPSIIGGQKSPMSARYYTFLNQVAKAISESHPGRYIGTLAYSRAEWPPKFPLERNILPFICDNSASWGNQEEKEAGQALLDAWMQRVDRIGIYEYLYGKGFFVPRLYTRHLAEKLRYVAENSSYPGFYAEIYSSHGFDGPKAWITEKLLWDPWENIDKLMTQWSIACFGPAAEPMKQYFESLEDIWAKNATRVKPSGILWGYRKEEQYEMFTPSDLPPLWKFLEEAEKRAGSDSLLQKRIDYFSSALQITDVLVNRYHAQSEAMQLIERKAGPVAVLASMLKNEPKWPQIDLWEYIEKKRRENWSQIYAGPEVTNATVIMEYILENSSWKTVQNLLEKGERNSHQIIQQAQNSLTELTPSEYENDSAAQNRMEILQEVAGRVAAAHKVEEPPLIDGKFEETTWMWNSRQWFVRNSARPFPYRTEFAFSYDTDYLYIALRAQDQDVETVKQCLEKHGQKATESGTTGSVANVMKDSPSIRLFIDQDKTNTLMQGYQLMVNCCGGLWENREAVENYKTFWNQEKHEWQTEIAVRWNKLMGSNKRLPYVRMNLLRHYRGEYSREVGGWYLSHETRSSRTAKSNERGWVIFYNAEVMDSQRPHPVQEFKHIHL